MSYLDLHKTLLSEMRGNLSDRHLGILREMHDLYDGIRIQNDQTNNFLEGSEKLKSNLEQEIQKLSKEKNRLSAEINSITADVTSLKTTTRNLTKKKRYLEKEISNLNSLYKGKAIGKGIYQKKHSDAIQLLTKLHKYATENRCETQEALEKSIKLKIEAAIKVCNICKSPEIYCNCEIK